MSLSIEESDYQEALEDFKEDFPDILYKIDQFLEAIREDEKYFNSCSELYLLFNGLRGTGQYLKFKEIIDVCTVVEEAVLVLKHRKPPIKQEMIDWLLMIYDHMVDWDKDLKDGITDLMPLDSYTLSMIKTASVSTEKSSDILSRLTVLIVEPSEALRTKLKSFLEPRVKKVYSAGNPNSVTKQIEKFKPDIIITETEFESLNAIDFIKNTKTFYKDVPFIALISQKGDTKVLEELEKIPVDGFFQKPLNAKSLLNKLWQIATVFYEQKWVKIADKELNKYIQSLKPLDENIKEVRRIGMDREATTKDLADVITKDPIMTAQVLKAVNSPIYGFRQEINSISHGVGMLGKDSVVAVILQNTFAEDFEGKMDFSPYLMGEDRFYTVAKRRMDLMTFWFSKVSMSDLALLNTSALLGNLGQVLISKEVIRREIQNDFSTIISETANPKAAEAEYFNTTTEDVTADILAYWGLEEELVDSIRFSFDLTNASNEIKKLAIANFVVYSTISTINPEINEETVENMAEFLTEMNFDATLYKKAVKKLQEQE
ncbi:MAG: response regulator [Campylobacterales bacterium]|nr:response regulator [Campylobacterales bacterium]